MTDAPNPLSLAEFWMPFTANRQFKKAPRLLAKASGMHYWDADGRQILDGCAGLWCVNVGYGRKEIAEDVSALFNLLTGYSNAPNWKRLAVAPIDLHTVRV